MPLIYFMQARISRPLGISSGRTPIRRRVRLRIRAATCAMRSRPAAGAEGGQGLDVRGRRG